jgi:hypothetical protein
MPFSGQGLVLPPLLHAVTIKGPSRSRNVLLCKVLWDSTPGRGPNVSWAVPAAPDLSFGTGAGSVFLQMSTFVDWSPCQWQKIARWNSNSGVGLRDAASCAGRLRRERTDTMAKQVRARKIKNRPRGGTGRNADTSAEVVRTPAVRRESREFTAKLGRRVAAHSPRAATTARSPARSTADSGVGWTETRFFTIVAGASIGCARVAAGERARFASR